MALAGRRRRRHFGPGVRRRAPRAFVRPRRGRSPRESRRPRPRPAGGLDGPDPWPGDPKGSDGFALLDILAGVTLLAVSMVGIGSVLGTQLLNISSTTKQDTAAALLDQAMEEVRAVPYQLVANGLSTSDQTIATDPNVSINGTSPNQTYTFVPTGEEIPHATLSYTQAPFVPHISTKSVDSTTFRIAA
ncbi:MAG TPA: hypothetical protein VMF60_07355, partial [Acidimicrobiales bacterium]|nr:hypothetical protein [Acidimicrobiales bacterium]